MTLSADIALGLLGGVFLTVLGLFIMTRILDLLADRRQKKKAAQKQAEKVDDLLARVRTLEMDAFGEIQED